MALINLFKVTKTLTDLLAQNIRHNIDPSLTGLLNVTGIPPEKVENPSNTLTMYLYHVAEDPHYKNLRGPGRDVPNVAQAPMALNLFYILTAHHETDSAFDADTQQKLMGYALKTFHDFPVITDQTRINGTFILDPDLRGIDNSLQVILRPVSPEDAIAFWNSEDTRTARLSAYYEVRVVMLEPEPPKTMPGIVLNVGTYLLQLGSPHLEQSQNVVRFKIPQKNGGSIQEIIATPARVTLDSSAAPPPTHNRFLILGTSLTRGKSQSLFLRNGIWAKLAPPAGPVVESVVDAAENPDWRVDFQVDRIAVQLAPLLRHINSSGSAVNLPVLPGFYTALVRSIVDEKVIANEVKRVVVSSNEVSFAVSPRIQGHDLPDADGNILIHLGSEFDPLDANFVEDAIQLILAGEVYSRVASDPPTNPKEYFVANAPSNFIRIKSHFPVTVTEPEAHALRLVVNGAESAPFWIELSP